MFVHNVFVKKNINVYPIYIIYPFTFVEPFNQNFKHNEYITH